MYFNNLWCSTLVLTPIATSSWLHDGTILTTESDQSYHNITAHGRCHIYPAFNSPDSCHLFRPLVYSFYRQKVGFEITLEGLALCTVFIPKEWENGGPPCRWRYELGGKFHTFVFTVHNVRSTKVNTRHSAKSTFGSLDPFSFNFL